MREDRRRADESGAATAPDLDRGREAHADPVTPPEWSLTLTDLTFTVRESARRKTLSIGVERDGELVILAPLGVDQGRVAELAASRRDWLYGKLAEKAQQYRAPRRREFVPGEGFWYAGRSYRLRLTEVVAEVPALRLKHGRFELQRGHVDVGRETFIAWYRAHLLPWAEEMLHRQRPRLHSLPTSIRVADLGHRWGSCGTRRDVTLHWRVALLPRRMAEYVLVHELVHLEHHHHRAAFWERLEVLLPDYAERKSWLALHGADYDL
ncbi:hypothetical protein RDMS_12795 [Deinococcus sp. RL]|uniref:M48 family metallopeptidase n=1 Tax=Deinococcus sp. RL TaxID=1489678 RepID=UPI0004D75FCF|nr:YgjP-like metallopeptidase domain-containing protein [Deinococcus sp. RL]KEF33383.1 hypothetical protein RDMS_12795 [Deinococcus sp. RL]